MANRSTSSLAGRTVLLVDDDKDSRDAIGDVLVEAGCRLVTAANGLEALQVLRAGAHPSAMLVDLDMPLMDGRTFCELCDGDAALSRIPRVLLTGNPYAAVFHSRAWVVLGKPTDAKTVLDSLARICAARALAA